MDFNYNIRNRKLSSENLAKVKDKSENFFEINGFLLESETNKIVGKKIKFIDKEKNNYFLKDVMINTLRKEVFGSDIDVKLNKKFLKMRRMIQELVLEVLKLKINILF